MSFSCSFVFSFCSLFVSLSTGLFHRPWPQTQNTRHEPWGSAGVAGRKSMGLEFDDLAVGDRQTPVHAIGEVQIVRGDHRRKA